MGSPIVWLSSFGTAETPLTLATLFFVKTTFQNGGFYIHAFSTVTFQNSLNVCTEWQWFKNICERFECRYTLMHTQFVDSHVVPGNGIGWRLGTHLPSA